MVIKKDLGVVNPADFGAKGDGIVDDSGAIQKAVDSFGGKPGRVELDGMLSYGIKNTVFVPYNVSIEGKYATIVPLAGGTLTDGFLFFVNATILKVQRQAFGGEYLANIEHLIMDNKNAVANVKGFYTKSKTGFKYITYRAFYQGVVKEGATNDEYTDMLVFDTLYFINCEGTSPLIDIKYNGDSLLIDGCHVAGGYDKNYNFLNLLGCNGGKIARCTNGDITINRSTAVSIENFHCEHGKIKSISSQVTYRNIYQWYDFTKQPIPLVISNADVDKPTKASVIENYTIVHKKSQTNMTKNYTDTDYFDAHFDKANVKITNFFRTSMMDSDQGLGMSSGVKISTDGTTINILWENNSHIYSKESYFLNGRIFTPLNEFKLPSSIQGYAPNVGNHSTFDEALTTYYYNVQYFFGYSDRKIVKNISGGEQSTTISDAAKVILLNLERSAYAQHTKIRIYRGTTAGQYTHYVDIPVGDGMSIYDHGYFVSTGERWKTRTAGGMDAGNTGYTKVKTVGENVIVDGAVVPTVGAWTQGDKLVSYTSTTYQEIICTVSGDFAGTAPTFITK